MHLFSKARRVPAITLPPLLTAAWIAIAPAGTAAEPVKQVKAFYLGNSFLENSVPWFHPTLAQSAGRSMEMRAALGPGWQIWMHTAAFDKGNYWARKSLVEDGWNAVVIQHFAAPGLVDVTPYQFAGPGRRWFHPPRDVGDVACAAEIIELLLEGNSDGRAFIYSSWPGIPGAGELRKRIRDEMMKSLESQGESREATLKKVKEHKLSLEQMQPLMRSFDYGKEWLAQYDAQDPEKRRNTHSRAYCVKLMEGLKVRFPGLWQSGRLALIPCGEVFYELDKKMRAGEVPGIENVGFFSRDGGHVRAGLPRYALAATCFAVMFRADPKALDWSIYNDLENYKNENLPQPGYVHQPDLGVLLEITPERARVVNQTVWEVVREHSYTSMTK